MKFLEEDLPTPTAMLGCPLGEATCTESPSQPFGMSSACWWRLVSKCQAAPVHWLHIASWEYICRVILQCFPKDQNVPAKQDVTRPSLGTGSDACPPWSPCRHEGNMPEIHRGQQEEDVPVQHHQKESRLKGLPDQQTVLYWWIYL